MPRGPGKTTLLAAVASAAIDGPLRVPRGEVVVVASSFEQSQILFRDMLAFVDLDAHDKDWRLHHSASERPLSMSQVVAVSALLAATPGGRTGCGPAL